MHTIYMNNRTISQKIRPASLFLALVFVARMRRCLTRFRKRKELLREWIDLQTANLTCIQALSQKAQALHLPSDRTSILMYGLKEISKHSQSMVDKIRDILNKKRVLFGAEIAEMGRSFSVYTPYIKKHMERLQVIKEAETSSSQGSQEGVEGNRVAMEENAQKIVVRTYQISILFSKYIKNLKDSGEITFFRMALEALNDLNQKHDGLIREQQKEQQSHRLEKLLGERVGSLTYSEKAYWPQGAIQLHVFGETILVQDQKRLLRVNLNKYSVIFAKSVDRARMACLVAQGRTLHFLFTHSKQLSKFVSVVRGTILAEAYRLLTFTKPVPSLFAPFLAAQVVDCRETRDLKGARRQEFTVVFSALHEEDLGEEPERFLFSSSVRESGFQWVEEGLQELNETVSLGLEDLIRIKGVCESEYGLQCNSLDISDFGKRVTSKEWLSALSWQGVLNGVLRAKSVIDNPILLLRQLGITDILLEASVSRGSLRFQGEKRFHCRVCSKVVVTGLARYLDLRLHFLARKYKERNKEFCYYIFLKVREEVCKVGLGELRSCRELIVWRHLRSGAIDYCFRKLVSSEKVYLVDVAVLGVEETTYQVEITPFTLASEVIDQVCHTLRLPFLTGYRLFAFFEDQEWILRANEPVLAVVNAYNIKYQKLGASSFLSKVRSFGKLLQLSEHGGFFLKQVIYYPLSAEEQLHLDWQLNYSALQFREEKLGGMSKESRLELIVLYSLREKLKKGSKISRNIDPSIFEKYVPNSLEEVAEESRQHLQNLYGSFKEKSEAEVGKMIENRLSTSLLFRKLTLEMRVGEISEGLSSSKRVRSVVVGLGWEGIVVFSFPERIVLRSPWNAVTLCLLSQGIKVSTDTEWVTLTSNQLWQIFQICREYQQLSKQAKSMGVRIR